MENKIALNFEENVKAQGRLHLSSWWCDEVVDWANKIRNKKIIMQPLILRSVSPRCDVKNIKLNIDNNKGSLLYGIQLIKSLI
jgi:hypothetical protein